MLSNKLTFSLVLMLALVVGPVVADTTSRDNLHTKGMTAEKAFKVVSKADSNAAAMDAGIMVPVVQDQDMVDLYELLRLGGTIELGLSVGEKGSTTHTIVSDVTGDNNAISQSSITDDAAAVGAYRLIITEIMWGLDMSQMVADQAQAQWIEIYNNGGALKGDDILRLRYIPNVRTNNIGKAVHYDRNDNGRADEDETFVVVDSLSTINRFGGAWALKGRNGNTKTIGEGTTAIPPTDLASMYRKVTIVAGMYKVNNDAKIDGFPTRLDGLGHGSEEGSWEASTARVNMTGFFIGSPGAVHTTIGGIAGLTKGFGTAPASIPATGVIINEVRNDPSESNLDWIELYHFNDAVGAVPQNLENWTLSIVTKTPKAGKTEDDLPTGDNFDYADTNQFSLPKFKLLPGEYLVIYNRHPGDTILAGGTNVEDVIAGKQVNKGASHLYIVREGLNLPSDKKFLLILRNGNDKANTHEKVVDYAGSGFFKRVETDKFNTDVWPFIGWTAPGDRDGADVGDLQMTFASGSMSFGRGVALNNEGMWRPKSRADNRMHKDDWMPFKFMGTGYDRDVDHMVSPGTPGYENRTVNIIYDDRENAVGKDDYAFGGTVTISEVMYDAGPRWNLIQWIELYNSSMTETVNLAGWTMEIRNESTDVESYVDSSFKFIANTELLPNQTLLVVSGTGANDVPQERVYNLYQHHRRELGLVARSSRLLSREGFYIRLTSKVMKAGRELDIDDLDRNLDISEILMDEAGNVEVEGAARNHMWDLPPRDPAARQSLVRIYGSRAIDGGPDMASDGLIETSWDQSDITGAALTFYGHRNDIGTPGFRLGGPLPVSLSKFRPVRNQTTGHVDITWITESELNNAGFNILRSEAKNGEYKVINVKGIIAGHGTTSEKHVYTFTDTTAKSNVVYYYQIEDVSLNGNRTTLRTTHLRGHVGATGKLPTRWGELKTLR